MINKLLTILAAIGTFLLTLFGIFKLGEKSGKKEQSQDFIQDELEDIKQTAKRREIRANASAADNRKFLRERKARNGK